MQELKNELMKYQSLAEEKAKNELSGLRSKAKKHIRNTERRIEDLEYAGNDFEENISPESPAMDKYSQRIYEKIQETLETINSPEKISMRTLNQYIDNTREALEEQDKTLIKYVKLLKDKKYKGRVKNLDKTLKRLNKDLSKLEDFVTQDYTPEAGIEDAPLLIEDTLELLDDYNDVYHDLEQHREEVKEKDEEIKELKQEIEDLRNHSLKHKIEELQEAYAQTQRDIDDAFGNVRKVLRKYDDQIASEGDVDTNLMSELVTDAASAFADASTLKPVKSILQTVKGMLEETKFNMSKEKRESALSDIEEFLDGKLDKLNQKATDLKKEEKKARRELNKLNLDSKISKLEDKISAAKRDRNRIFKRQLRKVERTTRKIERNLKKIRTKLQRTLDQDVQFESQMPSLPEWIEEPE